MKKNILMLIISLLSGVISTNAENTLYLDNFVIKAGETMTVELQLENSDSFGGFQCDIYLPDGLTANNFALTERGVNGVHYLMNNILSNGTYRLLCFSMPATDFIGDSGALVTFNITATADFQGEYNVEITNIKFTTVKAETQQLEDTYAVVMDFTTGVEVIGDDVIKDAAEYYNLQGIKIKSPQKGFYIRKQGTKTTKVVL